MFCKLLPLDDICSMTSASRVSVVIPTLDEAAHLEGYLDSVGDQEPVAEVVVVDGGSGAAAAALRSIEARRAGGAFRHAFTGRPIWLRAISAWANVRSRLRRCCFGDESEGIASTCAKMFPLGTAWRFGTDLERLKRRYQEVR